MTEPSIARETRPFREECLRCRRPCVACYCHTLQPLQTRTRVLIVQHPKEARHAVGTARMAHLGLPASALIEGMDFSEDARFQKLLAESEQVALLYPGRQAHNLSRQPAPPGPWTLLVIDGTWSQSVKLLKLNPSWEALPRFSFEPEAPSAYQIRKEPRPDYVSTVESLTIALGLLEGRDCSQLLRPFQFAIDFQLNHIAKHAQARFRTRERPPPKPQLPSLLRDRWNQLVLVHAENNPSQGSRRRHDVVHWMALRPASGQVLELFLQPEQKLGARTDQHLELPRGLLEAAPPRDSLAAAWRAFACSDDLYLAWGDHGVKSLQQTLQLQPLWDLRSLWAQYKHRKACGLQTAVEGLRLASLPLGKGRGGRRLGYLAALLQELLSSKEECGSS